MESMEATRMFRSTVDSGDVRRNGVELDGSLWKLLPVYRIRWNIVEKRKRMVMHYGHSGSWS